MRPVLLLAALALAGCAAPATDLEAASAPGDAVAVDAPRPRTFEFADAHGVYTPLVWSFERSPEIELPAGWSAGVIVTWTGTTPTGLRLVAVDGEERSEVQGGSPLRLDLPAGERRNVEFELYASAGAAAWSDAKGEVTFPGKNATAGATG